MIHRCRGSWILPLVIIYLGILAPHCCGLDAAGVATTVAGLPDFSYAGYDCGRSPVVLTAGIPVVRVESGAKDDTASLQHAIDQVSKWPITASGFRGIVEVGPGKYSIAESLRIRTGGVILLGSKDSRRPTILEAAGATDALLIVESDSHGSVRQPNLRQSYITDALIPVGGRMLHLDRPQNFSVGESIIVICPSTESWLRDINESENLKKPWTPGRVDLRYHRRIVAVQEGGVSLDAPLYGELNQQFARSFIVEDPDSPLVNVVIGSLTVELSPETKSTSEARVGVRMTGVENGWIRDVCVSGYLLAGFEFTGASRKISVESCRAVAPRPCDLGQGYAFRVKRAELILFDRCLADSARFGFVSCGGSFDSCIVVKDCLAANCLVISAASIGHWAQALLFDRLAERRVDGDVSILLANRGKTKEGEGGWNATNSVAWNCKTAGEVLVQQPPRGKNWAIGNERVNVTGNASESQRSSESEDSLYMLQHKARGVGTPLD